MVCTEPRGRNFAFVQKLENLPDDWEQLVISKLLPMAWVVHDKDSGVDPHVHFFVYFSGKRSVSGVVSMFSDLNVGYVEKIECKNAYLAYMLHLRQDDKHRYGYDELRIVNGLKVNFSDLADVDFSDVLSFVEDYSITRFSELVKATRDKEPPLFRYVTSHYALVCAYFQDERG